jgi:hypothetical protein
MDPDGELLTDGPGPPERLSALIVFLCKYGFLWGFCMGAQGA